MFAEETFTNILASIASHGARQDAFRDWLALRAGQLQRYKLPKAVWQRTDLPALPATPTGLLAQTESVWAVGGAVRDAVLGQVPQDIEFAIPWDGFPDVTEALAQIPDANIRIFARTRTAKVTLQGQQFELAALRQDAYEAGGVLRDCNGASIEVDATRRDFTCNALYYNNQNTCMYNPFGWQAGDPLEQVLPGTLAEDPIRIVRMFRFAHRLQLVPSAKAMAETKAVCRTKWIEEVQSIRLLAELNRAARSGVLGGVLSDLADAGWPVPSLSFVSSFVDSHEKSCVRWAAKHLHDESRQAFRNWLDL